MKMFLNSATRPCPTQLLFMVSIIYTYCYTQATPQELQMGFKSTPYRSPTSSFQPILNDPTGNFSLGFLPVDKDQLTLAVTHFPSLQLLWQAGNSTHCSSKTQVLFNGSLVIADPESGAVWSTQTQGDKVVLLNNSNLQVQKQDGIIMWQSFDYPQNTLVETQNFTSNMTLVSSDGMYSMRLGDDYMAMYAEFNLNTEQVYWRHKALEAKADVVHGQGPIYALVDPDGFLGMYQEGTVPPVDVQAFNTFNRPLNGFSILRLETDGNLKGYYWDGAQWVLDYQAISSTCELPSPCGSYGLCRGSSGPGSCSCLDNRTEFNSGQCFSGEATGDLCNGDGFWVLRREGVDLPFKELMGYDTVSSLDECEGICQRNCSCWGAVYNNASGFCYLVDYPIRTVLGVGDRSKVGYFKVREGGAGKKMEVGLRVGLGILGGAVLILVGLVWFAGYKMWVGRRGVKRITEEEGGVSPGPYKNLESAGFRSIEMCTSSSSR